MKLYTSLHWNAHTHTHTNTHQHKQSQSPSFLSSVMSPRLAFVPQCVHFMAMPETTSLPGLEFLRQVANAPCSTHRKIIILLLMLLSTGWLMVSPRQPLTHLVRHGTTMEISDLVRMQTSAVDTSPMLTSHPMEPTTTCMFPDDTTWFRPTGT